MKKEDRLDPLGGQAVIEGVMMRSKDHYAVACRRKDGTITTLKKVIPDWYKKFPFNIAFFRGISSLISTLSVGLDALLFSSNLALKDEGEKEISKKSMSFTMTITFILAIGIFVVIPYFLTYFLKSISETIVENQFLFNLIDGLFRIIIVVGYMILISLKKDVQRLFQYHGAEHKTIALYEKGVELTVEKVKGESRFHPRCGTSFIILVLFVLIIVHSIIFSLLPDLPRIYNILIRIGLIPIVAGIAYELIKLTVRFRDNALLKLLIGPGILIQHITTREPDEEQIEVAIESVKTVLEGI